VGLKKKKGGNRKKQSRAALAAHLRAQAAHHKTAAQIADADSTFKKHESGWSGKCFYCGRKIFVSTHGATIATVEHILPRSRGGTNDLKNLALACVNCNNEKGRNADRKAPDEYFDKLLAKRLEQWREPAV